MVLTLESEGYELGAHAVVFAVFLVMSAAKVVNRPLSEMQHV